MPLNNDSQIQVEGPTPKQIFVGLNKAVLKMLPPLIHKGGKKLRVQAKEWAPVVTGRYRKSIGIEDGKTKTSISTTVGVAQASFARVYARGIERKYRIFRRLKLKYKDEIPKDIHKGLNLGLSKLKIKEGGSSNVIGSN